MASHDGHRLGRRRRRLYWTGAIFAGASLLAAGLGVTYHRANRPETYRTAEEHAEITRSLARSLPEDAPHPGFVDVTQAAGLAGFRTYSGRRTSQLPEDMGSGAAWGDYDNDGDDDLFVVAAGGPLGEPEEQRTASALYENRGDGTFAAVDGFPATRILGMGAAWGDCDGDGWLDLIVTGFDSLRLFRNERGRFVRSAAIPERRGFWSGASWADFDRDGDLDLYVCGYVRYDADPTQPAATTQQYGRAVPYTLNPASFEPESNLLFRNDGNGRFEEVAAALGVDNPKGRSLSALWHDFDDDGWIDLYVANDISDNALFHNLGGRFEDLSHPAWVADYRGAMGLAAGDWNRDGDDDLFISHWMAQENALYDSILRTAGDGRQAQAGGLRFVDVADQRGLGQIALQYVGWGAEFFDFDADGWLDLAVANGGTFETEQAPKELRPQESFLFWSAQGKWFHDLAPLDTPLSTPHVSRGLAVSDYDSDGDLDLLLVDRDAGVRLLRNEMQSGNWIELRLARAGRPAGEASLVEGTRLVAHVGDLVLRRTISSGSYLSQSTRTVHFGLGAAGSIERLEVRWPDGAETTHDDLKAGRIWTLTPKGADPAGRPGAAADLSAMSERDRVVAFWEKQRAAMHAMKVDDDVETAIGLFREALALDPDHEDSIYYLGNCLAGTGDLDGALEQFARLMGMNPMSHRAHKRWGVLRATTARSAEDLARAANALERAVEINPEETGAMHALAEVALMQGDLATARQRLEWVVRTNPRSGDGLFLLAYVEREQGDRGSSDAMLRRALETRGAEVKPKGSTSEGDVRRRMHQESTPLVGFLADWDGSLEAERVFAPLDSSLAGLDRLR